MNKSRINSTDLAYVHQRLVSWGRYQIRLLEQGLGYPSRSPEQRIGSVTVQQTDNLSMNPDANEIETLLTSLFAFSISNEFNPNLVTLVKKTYTSNTNHSNVARELNISLRNFHDKLKISQTYLAALLHKNEEELV